MSDRSDKRNTNAFDPQVGVAGFVAVAAIAPASAATRHKQPVRSEAAAAQRVEHPELLARRVGAARRMLHRRGLRPLCVVRSGRLLIALRTTHALKKGGPIDPPFVFGQGDQVRLYAHIPVASSQHINMNLNSGR